MEVIQLDKPFFCKPRCWCKKTHIININNIVNTGVFKISMWQNQCFHLAEDKINHQYKWQRA